MKYNVFNEKNKKFVTKYKKTGGITLVALVVTIVVLLILAGITVTLLFGENGIIKKAQDAKEKQKIAEYEEIINQALLEAQAVCITENRQDEVLAEAKRILEANNLFSEATFSEIANDQFTITTKEEFVFKVTENGVTYLAEGIVENNNLIVKTSVNKKNFSMKYGCIYSDKIQLTAKEEYVDVIDYYIRAKADLATKERMFWDLSFIEGEDVMNSLEWLKTENITLLQYCEMLGLDFDSVLYQKTQTVGNTGLMFAYYMTFVEQSEKYNRIIAVFNKIQTQIQAENVNQVLSALYGVETTVEALSIQYNCSADVVTDLLYLQILMSNSEILTNEINSLLSEISQKYDELENEYNEYEQKMAMKENITIKLPDGTEVENSATYIVTQNGTYTFYVTYDGETTEYPVQVSNIGHKCGVNMTECYDNGDGTHTSTDIYKCGESSYSFTAEHSYGGGTQTISFSDNGNGTHTVCESYGLCSQCEASIENIYTVAHDFHVTSCVDNQDGTHTKTESCEWMDEGLSMLGGCGALGRVYTEQHTSTQYTPNKEGGSHTVLKCIECYGEYENSEPCVDNDGDGVCDYCNGVIY